MKAIYRWLLGLVIIAGCIVAVPLVFLGTVIGIHVATTRPGIGPVEVAASKIHSGMTRNEVRSLLGEPHGTGADGGDEWDYWEHRFVGSILRVHFGIDGRVAFTESWCQ